MFEKREGEQELGFDPAAARRRRPHRVHRPGPLALDDARRLPEEHGRGARAADKPPRWSSIEPYRRGLDGLERASHVVILTWLDRAGRNLIVQKPRHAGAASGVFALRSPARPNPIGLHIAQAGLASTSKTGMLALDAIDALDGTPVIDVKPYFASIDSVPEATAVSARQRNAPDGRHTSASAPSPRR